MLLPKFEYENLQKTNQSLRENVEILQRELEDLDKKYKRTSETGGLELKSLKELLKKEEHQNRQLLLEK